MNSAAPAAHPSCVCCAASPSSPTPACASPRTPSPGTPPAPSFTPSFCPASAAWPLPWPAWPMSRRRFLLVNLLGTLLWAAGSALIGFVPARKLPIDVVLEQLAGWLLLALLLAVIANILWKYVQRRKFIRSLWISRITPEDLKIAMDRGERPFVVDLRHPLEL